jgi:two-component system phosphate regulon sensor histidine kinase PhoR
VISVVSLQEQVLRLTSLVLLFAILGVTTDAWGASLALILAATLAWHGREFLRFARWSRHPLARPPHESSPWERPVLRLYRSLAAARARSRRFLVELRGLAVIMRTLPDAAVVLKRNGEIEQFNDAATRLLGLEARDRGRNLVGLVRHPSFLALLTDPGAEPIVEMPAPRDPERHLEIRRIQIDGDRELVLARDVTQLNRLLTTRQDFVANVSHELRTPLTVVIGYLETLEDPDIDANDVREILRRLVPPTRRMRALVDDLLLLTRLESSAAPTPEDLVPVRVDTMLAGIVEQAQALSGGQHAFTLQVEPGLDLRGVESELHSAFMNLVVNAVRYSPDGGRIDIRFHGVDGGARLEVRDQGLGIAPEHLARITERFYRVDLAGARVRGGTGLGLAIAKHVLKRHGSALEVESTLGQGSFFSCVFPATALVHTIDGKEIA